MCRTNTVSFVQVYAGFKLQAYALILLRCQGLPCIFYGDLFPNRECYDPRIGKKLERLIRARKQFAYGSTTDYFQYRNCIGFVRSGDGERPGCVVVVRSSFEKNSAFSGSEYAEEIQMRVLQKRSYGTVFRDFLGGDARSVRLSSDGWGTFPCPVGQVAVWIAHLE